MGVSYLPPLPSLTLFFAFIPLWEFICRQKRLKPVLIGAWLMQFLATLIGFNWLIYTIHYFGGLPWPLSLLGLLCFCAFANIFIVAGSAVGFLLMKKGRTFIPCLLFPAVFSLLHSLIPSMFPWNMGYPWFAAGLPAAQTAELWGFRFLSSVSYCFNFLFWLIIKTKARGTGRAALVTFLAVFAFLNILGFVLKKRLPAPDKTVSALVVQHNIGQLMKVKTKNPQARALFTLKELTYDGLIRNRLSYDGRPRPDFIVWPEGAYPYPVSKDAEQVKGMSSLARKIQTPVITGGVTHSAKAEKIKAAKIKNAGNSIFVVSKEGELLQPVYDKKLLLAFGEYMPLAKFFSLPIFRKFFSYFHGRFHPGDGPGVFSLNDLSIGFQVCYEGLFAKHARTAALKGAQILLNVTNDSWYGSWQQPRQHLHANLSRAVETRRPLLRATNTGLSAAVRADGSLMTVSPLNKQWTHLYKIPYRENPKDTLFMSWGFYFNEIFLSALSLFGLFSLPSSLFSRLILRRRRNGRARTHP